MDIKVVTLIAIFFLNLALGLTVFLQSKKSLVSRWFTLFAFGMAAWSFGIMMYAKDPIDFDRIYQWSLVLHFAGAFIAHSFFYFSLAYPEEKITLSKFLIFILNIPLLVIFYFLFIDQKIIVDLNILPDNRQLIYGAWYPFYFFYFFAYMGGGLLIMLYKFFKAAGEIKKQIGIVFLGILLPVLFAGFINMILASLGNFIYAWTGPIFLLIVLFLIAYAIVKLKFLDVKVITTEFFAIFLTVITSAEIFTSQSISEGIVRVIIFSFTLIFAILLIRSVLKEVRRREEMEKLAEKLSASNKKIEKINKQLQQANTELKHLDEAKSEFISIASHQLRTPLTAIKGYGSMLLDNDFGEITNAKQRDAVQKMFISGNRLISLVENLLNISRIESGRLKFDFEPKQLSELAREVYDTLKKSAEDRGLYLKFIEPKKPLPLIVMDDEKIRQVLLNFMDNAIKYTKDGGVTVSFEQKSDNLICRIADTGMGVGKEDQVHLFKKFSRGKDAFLINTEGTGLGLYVANMMIEAHQGKVWIESEGVEGKGSKFCFSLPLADSVTGKKLMEESKEESKKAPVSPTASRGGEVRSKKH